MILSVDTTTMFMAVDTSKNTATPVEAAIVAHARAMVIEHLVQVGIRPEGSSINVAVTRKAAEEYVKLNYIFCSISQPIDPLILQS